MAHNLLGLCVQCTEVPEVAEGIIATLDIHARLGLSIVLKENLPFGTSH